MLVGLTSSRSDLDSVKPRQPTKGNPPGLEGGPSGPSRGVVRDEVQYQFPINLIWPLGQRPEAEAGAQTSTSALPCLGLGLVYLVLGFGSASASDSVYQTQ